MSKKGSYIYVKKYFFNDNNEDRLQIRELTLANGLDFPSDFELIMLILGSGTRKKKIEMLSKDVLDVVLASNSDNLIQNLQKIDGIGKNKALAVAAALEFGRRMNRNPQAVLSSPTDVIPFIKSYAMQPTEHFLCISMNGSKEILSIRVVCVGSGNMAVLRSAEIFSEPVKERASAIIIAHNHPGGAAFPSSADIQTTHEILKASKLLGIALLDHVIITRNGYFSFLENDMLTED